MFFFVSKNFRPIYKVSIIPLRSQSKGRKKTKISKCFSQIVHSVQRRLEHSLCKMCILKHHKTQTLKTNGRDSEILICCRKLPETYIYCNL